LLRPRHSSTPRHMPTKSMKTMTTISATLPRFTSSITCATLVHTRSEAMGSDHTALRSRVQVPGKLICTSILLVLPIDGKGPLHKKPPPPALTDSLRRQAPPALSLGPTSPEKLPATRSLAQILKSQCRKFTYSIKSLCRGLLRNVATGRWSRSRSRKYTRALTFEKCLPLGAGVAAAHGEGEVSGTLQVPPPIELRGTDTARACGRGLAQGQGSPADMHSVARAPLHTPNSLCGHMSSKRAKGQVGR